VARVERTATRILGFTSPEMDFQLMRSLGASDYGGGAPGEIFAARRQIEGEDPNAWAQAFAALAARLEGVAAGTIARGRIPSSRDEYLRTSMYYRAAEYFADPFGTEARQWGLASRANFMNGALYLSDRIEAVAIPFEGKNLPGYFMIPRAGAEGGRTLLVLTGFDGTSEELYFQAACAGLERRFNVLLVDGPGQVGCQRFHPELTFRPDYEKPVGAMIDYALSRPEVAAQRLALYGISLGGYFALRAGIHDRRIAALILNSPIIDLHAYMVAFVGPELADNPPPLKLAEIDGIPDNELPRAMKLGLKASCRRFGVDSFAAWLARLKDFTAVDGLANVRCPSLAMAGAGEGGEAAAQLEQYCRSVSGPATRRLFTVEEGADMHCQVGNLRLSCAVVYDWLTEILPV
jgi:pimeloyl-ACP methyl ester carboxylesterase